ncbi:MAG: hypothetical protein B1H08_06580 [Candidatus Omnitrophica bacterium 4484_171]|nr:MAG: hypothetical protein B1H08_06580 [Candidatus Omnitrophica bacterium 4484_171]
MKTIALITDFGYTDNFVGVVKGVILKNSSGVNIIDITHNVSSHNIQEGAFILLKSYRFFPEKTVFLAVVDPGVGTKRRILAIKTNNYYFIGPDNGILYPAVKDDTIKAAVYLRRQKGNNISLTFHGRDIFAPLAAKLAESEKTIFRGKKVNRITPLNFPRPRLRRRSIIGNILYVDKFGNIVTNITKKDLDKINNGGFVARLNNKTIKKLYRTYSEAPSMQPFFIEGSFGYLEISLSGKSARDYFGLKNSDKIIILRKV